MKAKRFLSVLLCAALILTLQPVTALAAGDTDDLIFDISEGNITISDAGGGYLTVTYGPESAATAEFPGTQTITLTGATTIYTVTVDTAAADITLDNVSIDVSAENACAFSMEDSAVNLTLEETNTLISGGNNAGLYCPDDAELTINGGGSLIAAGGVTGSGGGAGIGGSNTASGDKDAGTIAINGGTINATAPCGGAGIGGGYGGNGGTVEINGGTVTAESKRTAYGFGGAGIGGGTAGDGGTIEINGGIVKAAGDYGAGLGGGYGGDGGTVAVSGGTVTATGRYGAGLGGGERMNYNGNGGTVSISGGSVKAVSVYGQAIGHGYDSTGSGTLHSGTLTNGGGEEVFLTKLTLTGAVDTSIPEEDLLFDGTAAGYGKTDLKTDSTGTLYFYFPEGGASAVYNGELYTENVENNHSNTLTPTGQSAYTVGYDLTDLFPDNPSAFAVGGQAFDVTLIPDTGFILPGSVTVRMGGAELAPGTDYTYNGTTGAITIGNVSGSILITAAGEELSDDPPDKDPSPAYYTVTAAQSKGGTIKLSKEQIAENGKVVVTVKADKGYKITDVLINGNSVGAVKKYKIENITEDITVSAVFEPEKKGKICKNPFKGSGWGRFKHYNNRQGWDDWDDGGNRDRGCPKMK